MKVSIFQPTYLPWVGIFKAIDWSDIFVFLDDVQYENHSWQSRNRIKSSTGELVLSVPIIRNFPQNINETMICHAGNWSQKHLRSIRQCYSRTPYFDEFFPVLEKILEEKNHKLLDLNMLIIRSICHILKIDAEFIFSSDLKTSGLHKNDKVIAILKETKADTYLYAPGAYDYMRTALADYEKNGISLLPLKFDHPLYPQLYGDFIPYLSVIDKIFNIGPHETLNKIRIIKI